MSTERAGVDGGEPTPRPMIEVARFEGRNRLTITWVIVVLYGLFAGLYLWVGPDIVEGEEVQAMIDAMPEIMNELMGFESLASLEGLFASEYYTLGWLVGLGGYIAYTAAGTLAGDLRKARLDTVLASPISRQSVLLGKYLALLVPILVLNVAIPAMIYLGSLAIGSPLSVVDLAIFHLLSMPYLLFWGACGLLLGVAVRGGRTAGRVAMGLVFATWLFESVISTTDFGWIGGVSPTRYLDPPAVLVDGTYDVLGAGLLLGGAIVFLALSLVTFRRQDL